MQFVIDIWNSSDMAVRITTRTLVNAQWHSAFGFSAARQLSAWDNASALLRPVDEGVLSIGAVVDVFYDGLWLPGDQMRPSGGQAVVTFGYGLRGGSLQAHVGIHTTTPMLRTTVGTVVENSSCYYCDVTISRVRWRRRGENLEWRPLPDFGLRDGGLG